MYTPLDCPNTAVGLYVKSHTGVAVWAYLQEQIRFSDAGILDPDCNFFNVHNGSLNMLSDFSYKVMTLI